MMAILITYPQAKVPVAWQQKLGTHDQVIYLPLRVLKARTLSSSDRQALKAARDLAITSPFGAQVFGQQLKTGNPTAQIHVLSDKLKTRLVAGGVPNPIKVSAGENRRSLAEELSDVNPDYLCWLIGDAARKYYQDYPGRLIVIYQNTWDVDHQAKARQLLSKQHLSAALITSPSNFDRFRQVMATIAGSDYRQLHYYVLGPGTGRYLAQQGLTVIYPHGKHQVLIQALQQLWRHEEAH